MYHCYSYMPLLEVYATVIGMYHCCRYSIFRYCHTVTYHCYRYITIIYITAIGTYHNSLLLIYHCYIYHRYICLNITYHCHRHISVL